MVLTTRKDRCPRHQTTVEFEGLCVPCLIEDKNELRAKIKELERAPAAPKKKHKGKAVG